MSAAKQPKLVKPVEVIVRAKYPPFIDQITAVSIGAEYQSVELHPWLQAQIDAKLLEVKP
jgi:hypothetical protein